VGLEVGTAVLEQGAEIDLTPFEVPVGTGRQVDVTPLETLLATTVDKFDKPTESDRWLGPRLHLLLRLTREEASRDGVWRWLNLGIGFDYVRWRFGPEVQRSRYLGAQYLNALGRLWWMSELFRDGPDYRPAVVALTHQDIAQNFLRMGIAHHRPTCQAFLRVPPKDDSDRPLTGREWNALAKATNCGATTLMLEAIGPDPAPDVSIRDEWLKQVTPDPEPDTVLLTGPDEPAVPEKSVEALTEVLTDLFAKAPVRSASSGEDADSTENDQP
jgi:hypothetical protein